MHQCQLQKLYVHQIPIYFDIYCKETGVLVAVL